MVQGAMADLVSALETVDDYRDQVSTESLFHAYAMCQWQHQGMESAGSSKRDHRDR